MSPPGARARHSKLLTGAVSRCEVHEEASLIPLAASGCNQSGGNAGEAENPFWMSQAVKQPGGDRQQVVVT